MNRAQNRTALGALCFILFSIVSCQSSDFPKPVGSFVGLGVDQGQPVQMIAQIPHAENQIQFQVYPVLASAQASHFQIKLGPPASQKRKLVLSTDLVTKESPTQFSVDSWKKLPTSGGQCAQVPVVSETDPRFCLSELCISNKKIDLEVIECRTGDQVASMHLEHSPNGKIPPAKSGGVRAYRLDEVMGRAKFLNYSIRQEAERVVQAREVVKTAFGNLFPRIQIRNIFSFILMDPAGVVEGIGNLLPFLFPSNWYQWEGSKNLLQAEYKSFASLRGNEMQAAETLYYLVQRDLEISHLVDSQIQWIQKFEENSLAEEAVGALPRGSAEYFGTKVLAMRQDQVQIHRLLSVELAALSQAVALSPVDAVTQLPSYLDRDLSQFGTVDPIQLSEEAKKNSLEVAALESLALANDSAVNTAVYGFLNPSSEAWFGFGTAPRIRGGQAYRRELEQKRDEILALVEQRAMEIKQENDAAIESYRLAKESLRREQNRLNWMMQRHFTGDSTLTVEEFLNQVAELQQKILLARSNQVTSVIAFELAQSKRSRLVQEGFYQNLTGGFPFQSSDQGQINCKDLSLCTTHYGF